MKIKIYSVVTVLILFILQTTVFQTLSLAWASPNLLIIAVSAFAMMDGRKHGLYIGFLCGLLLDIFSGSVIGFYALIYMLIGYGNGFLHSQFFPDDIRLPLIMIGASDLVSNLAVYFFRFFFRGQLNIGYYLMHLILPELVYTSLVSIVLYLLLLKLDQKIELMEKEEQ